MSEWALETVQALWHPSLAVVPLALGVAVACRALPLRPATRHAMWLAVLVSLLAPAALPRLPATRFGPVEASGGADAMAPAAPVASAALSAPTADSPAPPLASETPPRAVSRADAAAPERLAAARPPAGSPPLLITKPTRAGDASRPPPGLDRKSPLREAPEPVATPRVSAPDRRSTPPPRPRRVAPRAAAPVQPRSAAGGPAAAVPATPEGSAPLGRNIAPGIARVTPPVPADALLAASTPSPGDSAAPTGREAPGPDATDVGAALGAFGAGCAAALLGMRDQLGRIPSLPPTVWLAGSVVLAAIIGIRSLRFRWRLRNSRVAGAADQALVREVAAALGLRRVPEARFVRARISPLVWCGRRARLVLPAELWAQLDGWGRRAVLCHELAHLRRGDHVVQWFDVAVGLLYWWHPVVWWVRRRLREEAEFACDAWVTWLMPRQRRAYAEALLAATGFVGGGDSPAPAIGMSVSNLRASPFVRRLKMVMCEQRVPGRSFAAFALSLAIVVAAWAATPARSCPPKEGKSGSECNGDGPAVAPAAISAAAVDRAVAQALAAERAAVTWNLRTGITGQATTPMAAAGSHAAERPGSSAAVDVQERLARLERQLVEITRRLESLSAGAGHGGFNGGGTRTTTTPPRGGLGLSYPMPQPPALFNPHAAPGEAVMARTYKLPKGKLEALGALMIRADVPIRVATGKDAITVHATRGQHEVFAAFVQMIHPDSGTGARGGADAGGAGQADSYAAASELYTRALQEQTQARARALRAEADGLDRMAEDLDAKADQLDHQAEQFEQQSQRLTESIEQIAEQMEEVQGRLEGDDSAGNRAALRDAVRRRREDERALRREIEQLQAQAERLRRQRELLREQGEQIRRRSEQLQGDAEHLQERSDLLDEALHAILRSAEFAFVLGATEPADAPVAAAAPRGAPPVPDPPPPGTPVPPPSPDDADVAVDDDDAGNDEGDDEPAAAVDEDDDESDEPEQPAAPAPRTGAATR